MPTVALQAYFDGERIVLDEEFALAANARLLVMLLPPVTEGTDVIPEEAWLRSASGSEAFAFLADPAEDIYTPEDGKPLEDAF